MPAQPSQGFTLIEMLCVMAIMAILSSVAYPGFQGVVQKTRRADAWTAIVQVQQAQERYRSNHVAYGSLADIGRASLTPGGHYTLRMTATSATGYTLAAVATGAQAGDRHCRWLTLTVHGLHITQASGADAEVTNASPLNRQCWGPA
jgi:type IV pilus assembly protein PilE